MKAKTRITALSAISWGAIAVVIYICCTNEDDRDLGHSAIAATSAVATNLLLTGIGNMRNRAPEKLLMSVSSAEAASEGKKEK